MSLLPHLIIDSDRRTLCFSIKIQARVKKRARILKSGFSYTPASTRVFERALSYFALSITRIPTNLPCEIHVWSFIRNNWKGDATNYLKAVEDALNKTIYVDDDQLSDTHSHRRRRSALDFIHIRFTYDTPEECRRCLPALPISKCALNQPH